MQITITENKNSVYEIKKSQFVSFAISVTNETEIKERLLNIKKEHKDARHVCYAYVCGNIEKCSDDGEPSGTAGKPLLDLIKNNGFTNILLVVVRYFGGIKLGAGGLYRAYLTAGKEVLAKCVKLNLKPVTEITFSVLYGEENSIFLKIKPYCIGEIKINYLDNIQIKCIIENMSKRAFENVLPKNIIEYSAKQIYIKQE